MGANKENEGGFITSFVDAVGNTSSMYQHLEEGHIEVYRKVKEEGSASESSNHKEDQKAMYIQHLWKCFRSRIHSLGILHDGRP